MSLLVGWLIQYFSPISLNDPDVSALGTDKEIIFLGLDKIDLLDLSALLIELTVIVLIILLALRPLVIRATVGKIFRQDQLFLSLVP